jgi:hypothetical protein
VQGQLGDWQSVRRFLLGGDAYFTLKSKKTGSRRTFHVLEAPKKNQKDLFEKPGYFVYLLVGPDNLVDYKYLGFMWEDGKVQFREGTRSFGNLCFKWNKEGWAPEDCRVFEWLQCRLNDHGVGLDQCEFWHEGRCGVCGRMLTTPESVRMGLGPICSERHL